MVHFNCIAFLIVSFPHRIPLLLTLIYTIFIPVPSLCSCLSGWIHTHTHSCCLTHCLIKQILFIHPTYIFYSLIYVILCVWLSLKSIMVLWSTSASSEEVALKLNAKWTVATLLSQLLSDHRLVNRNYKQNQGNLIVQLRKTLRLESSLISEQM